MHKYLVKRMLMMVPTLIGAAILVFTLMHMIPGDVCALRYAGTGGTFDVNQIEQCKEELGLNRPLLVQFFEWIGGFFIGDFGTSMWTDRPITEEMGPRVLLSLQVAVMATIISILISIPLGTISAVKQNSWIDYTVRCVSIAGIAMPSFWLGILIMLGLLAVSNSLLGYGWIPPIQYIPPLKDPIGNLTQLIWPALATGYRYSAVATRMTRSALLEVLREDYIRTARAKGVIEKLVVNRHALKNSMLPVVTVIGIEFAFLMGGLVVTEQVFNLNGLGKLFVDSVTNHDYTLTQALVMLVAFIFVVMNIVIDVIYAWLDPRIRYS
ncbi:MAG: ABC transporter permease [Rhodospirillales bacterium]|jgi:peptide/nickel transport system permease protein